jgi:hypothetical protein
MMGTYKGMQVNTIIGSRDGVIATPVLYSGCQEQQNLPGGYYPN